MLLIVCILNLVEATYKLAALANAIRAEITKRGIHVVPLEALNFCIREADESPDLILQFQNFAFTFGFSCWIAHPVAIFAAIDEH